MTVDHEWLKEQVNNYSKKELPIYELYSQLLARFMERACDQFGILGIVNTRTKTIPSFAEKTIRKSHKYGDPINQLTDLCGARIITLTQEETDRISKYIREHFIVDEENSLDLRTLLKAEEFGYRSVHYVVQLNKDSTELQHVVKQLEAEECNQGLDAIEEIGTRKAEIQVRTLLQHAWAMISHDRFYKSNFEIPEQFKRELARVAALLEAADEEFGMTTQGIDDYRMDYGAYMSHEEIRQEVDKLEMVLSYNPGNLNLAHRIGQLSMAMHDWPRALKVLEPFRDSGNPIILRDIGMVKHRSNSDGRADLEKAVSLDPNDAIAWCALGDSLRDVDMASAINHYEHAFRLAHDNPHILGRYLECKLQCSQDMDFLPLMFPTLKRVIERCNKLADAKVYLPAAFFDIGIFSLLMARPYQSLNAFAKAITLSSGTVPIHEALRSIESFRTHIISSLPDLKGYENLRWGIEAVKRFLNLAIVVKARQIHGTDMNVPDLPEAERSRVESALKYLRKMRMTDLNSEADPFIIMAGGCSEEVQKEMDGYRSALDTAFKCFTGTIIAGGSKAGVSGIIGDLEACSEDTVHKIGYIPHNFPVDETIHSDFEIHRSRKLEPVSWLDSQHLDFTPLEPIQVWIDLVTAGVDPSSVRLLGINGGDISAFEYRMALALGATIGVMKSSGRSAAELQSDSQWWGPPDLLWLPNDEMTLRAFVDPGYSSLEPEHLERIGKVIHNKFLEENRYQNIDPAMMPWDELRDDLKDSNRYQANYAEKILRSVGWEVRELTDQPSVMDFTEEEIEEMAEMEHGRWIVERLRSGWSFGPERDPAKMISPYLASWKDLPDEIKDYDRRAVKDYPDCLRKAGLEIVKIG